MNTNNNVYTIVYTTVIVVVAAAILAIAAMALKPKQDANIKAETISQMLTAAGFSSKEDLARLGNDQVLAMYSENIANAFLIDAQGNKIGELGTDKGAIELQDNLKMENKKIASGNPSLPVYVFEKDGQEINVIPCYGAGLWGPIWGYIAFNADCTQIVGAYFDHESETPGLGAKIKDETWFREQFKGKSIDLSKPDDPFGIIKGGASKDEPSRVDAITGATITCKGLDSALDTWFQAYLPFLAKKASVAVEDACCDGEGCGNCGHDHHHDHGHHHGHHHEHNHQEG